MTLIKIRNTLLILILISFSGSFGYYLKGRQVEKSRTVAVKENLINTDSTLTENVDFSLFWDVWRRLQASYVDKTKLIPSQMVYGAIGGMVDSLGDPYTVLLPAKENREAKEELGGTFEGIGAQLGMKDKKVIVVAPLKGTPAEEAGLKSADWIVKVDDKETAGWTVTEAVNKIRGPKGSKVKLTVLHENENKTQDITIIRNSILVKSVENDKTYWQMKDGRFIKVDQCSNCAVLAHLKLTRFGDQTNDEWNKEVNNIGTNLRNNQIKGVVFDMRNNPGGYLQGAVFITSEFLKKGLKVVTQEYSNGNKEEYLVTRDGKLLEAPLVVLIDQGSASASEIVAGALKDYNRAKLIGNKTFGKGSIQEAQELSGGAGLHITIAKWLLPKGSWINGTGVEPDKTVENKDDDKTDLQLEEAANMLLSQ